MKNKKAFPSKVGDNATDTGMDLRDYFAAKAMQAYITGVRGSGDSVYPDQVVESAYSMADVMLKAREL